MSRRSVSPSDDARWVFNRLAADYAHRPGYPPALVARLLELAGTARPRVADLGAGTGLLALPLARAGARVHAVEPARAMLAALAEAARSAGLDEAVVAVHAAAEATGLPDGAFDLVVLADALHWTDAARAGAEARRLLAPGGAAAVVVPRLEPTPFLDALRARLAAANPRARPAEPPVALFLSHAGCEPLPEEAFLHEVALEGEALDAVLRSLSLVGPALGPEGVARLLEEARALARAHGGAAWRRRVALHAGRRRAAPG